MQAGDSSADLDYQSTTALALNGGTIKDAAGNNATLTLATPGAANSLGINKEIIIQGFSSNANLSSLALNTGTLSPVFSAATTNYTVSVQNTTSSITITPTVDHAGATVKVNGTSVNSGSASGPIALTVGANTITTEVSAQDGTTTKTYTLTVTRAASTIATLNALSISSGTLSPAFSTATTSYNVSVQNATSSVTITPTVDHAGARVKVNGTSVNSGSASGPIALSVGANTITTEVTAQDGTTIKTYTIAITRATGLSSDADLSGLSLSNGNLNTIFAPATTSYTATVPYSSSSITLSPTLQQSNAVVKVNGIAVASATSSQNINLNTGANTITVIVTAQDGTTSKTYTVTITRAAPSTIANLSGLSLSAGTLSPAFSASTTSYTLFVNNPVNSTTVNPVKDHAGASIKVNNIAVTSGTASGSITLDVGSNTITTAVTAEDGITTKTYTVRITRVKADQTLPDQSGGASTTSVVKEVVVTSPTLPVTVNVPVGETTTPTIAYGSLISSGTGTIPETTIKSSVAEVRIPSATVVTGSKTDWDGIISAPAITNYTPPAEEGKITTPFLVIEVGSPNISLSFNQGVRVLLPGQAGRRAARIHGGIYTEITTIGRADTQVAGDALPADGSFKIDVGPDLVIWTKAFSTFITFTQNIDPDIALAAADKTSLDAEMIRGANIDLDHITTSLTNPLPSFGANGSVITWSSDKPAVVSADGKTINRPILGTGSSVLTLTATIKKGLRTETKAFTLTVLEQANQAPTLNAIANQVICHSTGTQSIALSGISPGQETGQTTTLSLSSSNSTLLSGLTVSSISGGNAILNFITADPLGGTTNITVTVKDNGGNANGGTDSFTRTFSITVNPLPSITIRSSLGTTISKGFTTDLTASGGTSYIWSTEAGIIGGQNTATLSVRPATSTTYIVTATNATGCISIQNIRVEVKEDYSSLEATNILTPNGDGINDFLLIKNLDMYPNNTIRIFDRSGRQVYVKQNYANDWNGSYQGSPLQEGTYYFILELNSGTGKLKGFVSIINEK